ncbi:glycosyltransferase [Jidongwangia harbinensis]|uniref:glycosyltransferase n=1 Tax=Jidongwangia harbinensis TaxID=2878561 RepID=UPI001CD93056|nr:nucleotide disphospho-sugar-binding domain-containing protein [Jidongwangia harbinensis]MCA2215051.1 glycosyltransferase [Jidongwangia harbinensis]
MTAGDRRYLFVVPPLTGHVNPTIAVAEQLRRRGHRVAWAGPEAPLRRRLPGWARVFPTGDLPPGPDRWLTARGAAGLKYLWEDYLLPLARAMRPGVADAVAAYAPDVLVADQHALAGAVVARAGGLPWATSASNAAEFAGAYRTVPKVGADIARLLADFAAEHGQAGADLRFSGHLVLIFSTPQLAGPVSGARDTWAFVGPALGGRPPPADFPWPGLAPDRARVLVSAGTLNTGLAGDFYRTAAEAFRPLAGRVQVILVAPPAAVPDPPGNVLVRPFVPQLELLPHLDAVVCHGGHNTVCEALAYGVPLVVAPIRHDGPVNADQVVGAGAGVRTRFARLTAAELSGAVLRVLDEPGFRAAARRIAGSFRAAGGARAAADRLEALR